MKKYLLIFLFCLISAICFSQDCEGPPGGNQGGAGNDFGFGFYIFAVQSADPNLIVSPLGFDSARWVSVNDNMGYNVYFENDPDFATAPAQNVFIFYKFNEFQDPTTFRVGSFGFNGMIFTVPTGLNAYNARLDLKDELGFYVDVIAGVNVVDSSAFWIFQSIDPLTNLPPADPFAGFLPVKDSTSTDSDTVNVAGEGFVSFTCNPTSVSDTRDTIFAQAHIIFDENDTIDTNIDFNTIDALPPVSNITHGPVSNNEVILYISALDDPDASDVKYYDLYVAQDSLSYITYKAGITDASIVFPGSAGSTYHFFTLATDNTGNREELKSSPDASITFPSDSNSAPVFVYNNETVDELSDSTCGEATSAICISISDAQGDTYVLDTTLFPIHGIAKLQQNEGEVCISYTPDADYAGTDQLILQACDPSGNCSVLTLTYFSGAVGPVVITASGSTTLCEGQNVMFSTEGTYSSYSWSNGATDSSITVTEAGYYAVTVSNEFGCTSTSNNTTVDVNDPQVSIAALDDTIFCIGDHVRLVASHNNGNVQWYRDGLPVISENGSKDTLFLRLPGSYYCKLTDELCEALSNTVHTATIGVKARLKPEGMVYACEGEKVKLKVLTSSDSATYHWYKNNLPILAATNDFYIAEGAGIYHAVASKDGCHTFTHKASISIVCKDSMQSETMGVESFVVYPNPTMSDLTVSFYNEKEGKVIMRLFDANAKVVYTGDLTAPEGRLQETIDISFLPAAMYSLQVITSAGKVLNQKIVKILR